MTASSAQPGQHRLANAIGIGVGLLVAVSGVWILLHLVTPTITQTPTRSMTVRSLPSFAQPTPSTDQAAPTAAAQPMMPSRLPALALPLPELPALPQPQAVAISTASTPGNWRPAVIDLPTTLQVPDISGQQHAPRRRVVPDLTAFYPQRARRRHPPGLALPCGWRPAHR